MSRWQRFKDWFRREKAPDTPSSEELREFVYLDDVSVDSLVMSARGGILDQITQTTGSEVHSEFGSTVGGSTPVSVRSRVQTATSEGLQTLRRAGIQARFGELHKIVEHRRVLQPPHTGDKPPAVASVADVQALAVDQKGSQWAVAVGKLSRGDVVELDVELGAEPLFHLVSAISQIIDLWPDEPGLVGLEKIADIRQLQAMSKMLSVMLGGLVPIRSHAIDFDVVDIYGEPWLVHHKVLNQLSPECFEERRPLHIVGLAAEDRFWKDQRRVAFAGARYRILARLVDNGTSQSWTPVKMVDTFKDIVPGFAAAIDDATRKGQELLSGPQSRVELPSTTVPAAPTRVSSPARDLFEAYGRLLGERVGVKVTARDLVEAGLMANVDGDLPSVEELRALLGPVTEYVQGLALTSMDPVVVSNTRLDARREIESHPSLPIDDTQTQRGAGDATAVLLLEVEFVGIYW